MILLKKLEDFLDKIVNRLKKFIIRQEPSIAQKAEKIEKKLKVKKPKKVKKEV